MIIVIWLLAVLVPLCIGMAILLIVNRFRKKKRDAGMAAAWLVGALFCLGMAEVSQLAAIVLALSLGQVCGLYAALAGFCTLLGGICLLCNRGAGNARKPKTSGCAAGNRFIPALFFLIFLAQVIYIYYRRGMLVAGDIVLETVQSFLAEDGIYKVQPLTGQLYTQDMPMRIRILCLPTLYAVLSRTWGIDAAMLVQYIVPTVVLAASYLAYYCLSGSLFGDNAKKKYTFLIMVALLYFFGEQASFSDGFGMLYAGYLGTSIRNMVLVPFALSAFLDRRFLRLALCLVIEICITWTFWGAGVCAAMTAALAGITLLRKLLHRRDADGEEVPEWNA